MTVGRLPSIDGGIQPTLLTTTGDIMYASAASTPARLGIGSAGQVLTVASGIPSWATASSGGMTLISTTSLSGASTTISSIPGTYKNLQLVIRDLLPATDTAGLNMRLNGDSTANRYTVSAWGQATNTALAFDDTQLGGIVQLIDNAVTKNLTIVNFYDYTNTTTYRYGTVQGVSVNGTDSTKITTGAYHLYYNQTNAITSITLLMGSGNITSGSALLYGVS